MVARRSAAGPWSVAASLITRAEKVEKRAAVVPDPVAATSRDGRFDPPQHDRGVALECRCRRLAAASASSGFKPRRPAVRPEATPADARR